MVLGAKALTQIFTNGAVSLTAVRDITLTVKPGEFVALVGPSGSGKSTLLNLLGLNVAATSGSVFVAGQEFLPNSSAAQRTKTRRREIGFVFQHFHLLPSLSALENIMVQALLNGASAREAKNEAKQRLAEVGLTEKADRLPHELSGGEMQRVGLCRALVHHPKIILADEPTGALDRASGDAVLQLLQQASAAGAAVVMATHSEHAMSYATRTLRLRDGVLE